jgi:hypothetical protein
VLQERGSSVPFLFPVTPGAGTTYVAVFGTPSENDDMSTEASVLFTVRVLLFGGGGGYGYSRR